jgi:uncharacterized cupredoxin-like copper-binding protein
MRNLYGIGVLVVVVALGLSACAGAASPSEQNLTVEAVDLGFEPKTIEVTAGEPVKLMLQNTGALEHDLSVLEFPMEGTAEETGGSGHDMGHSEGEAPQLHVAALGGQSATLEFTATKPGTYDFWCTVPGHKEAGMVGTLVVAAP